MESEKNCDCGHTKHDHEIIQKSMTKLAILDRGFFIPMQLGHGMCKKCTCHEYYPPRLFRSKRNVEYHVKPTCVLEDSEKRCRRCGTLFERHSEINHPFHNDDSDVLYANHSI